VTGRSVAILGGGIMGSALALFLARRGASPVIFEQMPEIIAGASRWNEGKIHLGYMYSADASLDTARRVIAGGLAFVPLVEDLIETPLSGLMTEGDDVFLCHAASVVPPDLMAQRLDAVAALVRAHPGGGGHGAARRFGMAELARLTGSPAIVAGFHVPERSVQTRAVADLLRAAVEADGRIRLCCGRRVVGVEQGARWRVLTPEGAEGPFDCVVNALWQGRLPVDVSAGLPLPADWSQRYRLAVFLRTRRQVDAPGAVIAAGPFGDIKNYNGRDFYLSWYPAGLQHESRDLDPQWTPPAGGGLDAQVASDSLAALEAFLPQVAELRAEAESIIVAGGWVYAAASGSLAAPAATIHRRADFGITRRGSYVSVDTGKYSTAPWLAQRLAAEIA